MRYTYLSATILGVLVMLACPSAWAEDVAWAVRINGAPTVQHDGKPAPLRQGDAVHVGDMIETDAAAKVKILLADDSVLAIGPRSRITLEEFVLDASSRRLRLAVLLGRFKFALSSVFGPRTDCEVSTPTAVAGVRGTVLWGDTELDAVCALEGHIQIRSRSGSAPPVVLHAGECARQMAAGKTTPMKPTAKEIAAYLKDVTLK